MLLDEQRAEAEEFAFVIAKELLRAQKGARASAVTVGAVADLGEVGGLPHLQVVADFDAVAESAGIGELAVATDGPSFRKSTRKVGAVQVEVDGARYHTVTFADLEPMTRYVYRVGDGVDWSEWSHFSTASRGAAPFSFLYFGDAQNSLKSHWSRVIREGFRDAPRAAFIVHAGDLVKHRRSRRSAILRVKRRDQDAVASL